MNRRRISQIEICITSIRKNITPNEKYLEKKYINEYKGFGVLAKERLSPGTYIGEYKGQVISEEESDKRIACPGRGYLFFYQHNDKTYCIDAEKTKSIVAIVNDGGKKLSNCVMKKIMVDDVPHLCLFVKECCEIQQGCELLYDYGDNSEQMYWRKNAPNPFPYVRPRRTPSPPESKKHEIQKYRNNIKNSLKITKVNSKNECEFNLHSDYVLENKITEIESDPNRKQINLENNINNEIESDLNRKRINLENNINNEIESDANRKQINLESNINEIESDLNRKEINLENNINEIESDPNRKQINVENKINEVGSDPNRKQINLDVVKEINSLKSQMDLLANVITRKDENRSKDSVLNSNTIEKDNKIESDFNIVNQINTLKSDIIWLKSQMKILVNLNIAREKINTNDSGSNSNSMDSSPVISAVIQPTILESGLRYNSTNESNNLSFICSLENNKNLNIAKQEINGNNLGPSSNAIDSSPIISAGSQPTIMESGLAYNSTNKSNDISFKCSHKSYENGQSGDSVPSCVTNIQNNFEEISNELSINECNEIDKNLMITPTNLNINNIYHDEVIINIDGNVDSLDEPLVTSVNKIKDSKRKNYCKPKRPCPFCGEFRHSLSRHLDLMHKKEPEVEKALSLPINERRKIFDILRKRGIDNENQKRLKINSLEEKVNDLIGERKTHKNRLRRCNICKGFYVSKHFYLHVRTCEEKYSCLSGTYPVKFSAKTGHILLHDNLSNVTYSPLYVSHVLEKFRDDDVGNMCRTNSLLKYIGYYLFISKSEEKGEEKEKTQTDKKDIMAKMRLLCKLYLNFKVEVKKDISFEEMFDRNYMDEFKMAVQKTLEKNKTSRHTLGFLVLKSISILECRLSVLKREEEGKEFKEFRNALNNNLVWIPLFGKQRTYKVSRSQFQLRKPSNLPPEEDMRKVRLFLLNNIRKLTTDVNEFDIAKFKILRGLLLTRLTFLNARRGGEPCRLLISQWKEAKKDKWLNEDFVKEALKNEMTDSALLGEFKIAYQKGKGIKTVSVMIPKSCFGGLDIMSNEEIRCKAGIHIDNKYLFPTAGINCYHVQGVAEISIIMKESGITKTFKAKDIRHYVSTKQAMLNLSPDVRTLFYLHMGHEETINKSIYQSPLVLESLLKVGKILKTLDEALDSSQDSPIMQIEGNETQNDSSNLLLGYEPLKNKTAIEDENNLFERTSPEANDGEKKVKKKGNLGSRVMWTPLKKKKIMDEPLFQKYLTDLSPEGAKGKVPPKEYITIFLNKNQDIFPEKDEASKIKLVRSKVIGMRQTNRRRYKKIKFD